MLHLHTFIAKDLDEGAEKRPASRVNVPAGAEGAASAGDAAGEAAEATDAFDRLVAKPHWLLVSRDVRRRLHLCRMLADEGIIAAERGADELDKTGPLEFRHVVLLDDDDDSLQAQIQSLGIMSGVLNFRSSDELAEILARICQTPRCC